MNKKIIALAIASAFSTSAFADMTMYGSFDGGIRHQSNASSTVGNTDSLQLGQFDMSRIGFKGVTDLKGAFDGFKAEVVLESNIAPGGVGQNSSVTPGIHKNSTTQNINTSWDYNTSNPLGLLFDRQATLSILTNDGSATIGWNETAAYKTLKAVDPLAGKYLSLSGISTMNAIGPRAGSYTLVGNIDQFKVTLEHDFSNFDKNNLPKTGAANAIALDYSNEAFNASIAYTTAERTPAHMQTTPVDNSATHLAGGLGYKLSDVKFNAGISSKKTGAADGEDVDISRFGGVTYKAGDNSDITAAYYSKLTKPAAGNETVSNLMILSTTYALAPSTHFYFEVDRKVSTTSSVDTETTGWGMGVNTAF